MEYNQEWRCLLCRKEVFPTSRGLDHHLKDMYLVLNDWKIHMLSTCGMRSRVPPKILLPECVFCGLKARSGDLSDREAVEENEKMIEHIARHLLEISMTAFPAEW